MWRRVWQEDPRVVGQTALLRGEPHTIVGVMPPGFRSTVEAEIWTPLRPTTTGEGGGTNFEIVGRLREGTSWEQAGAEVEAVGARLLAELDVPSDVQARFGIVPLHQGLTRDLCTPLLVLWAAVGAVLLIGCVNVASMLLAQGAGRAREIGTRVAMGARPGAIVRQLLAESLVYALLGGAAGVVVGSLGLDVLERLGGESFPFLGAVSLDARVALATGGLSVLACLIFGVFPALRAANVDVRTALGGSRGIAGPRSQRPLRLMVLGQVALAVPLLVAATLLVRTFAHLWQLDPGFDATNVVTASVSLQDARYRTAEKANRLFRESVSLLAARPGVEAAAVSLSLPYERRLNTPFRLVGGEDELLHQTALTYVTPDYFRALEIPLVRGRTFTEADGSEAEPVLVVNQAFAERYLRGREPLGTELRMSERTGRIVGIVCNVQQQPSWGTAAPLASVPSAYIPAAQTNDAFLELAHTWFSPSFIVKSSGPIPNPGASIQEVVAGLDPLLPVAGARTLADVKSRALALNGFLMTLLSAFAGLATVLACVGVYGMVANAVAARGRELCIRMAVGATVPEAVRVAMRPGVAFASAGAVAGLGLALLSSGLLEHLIWGVRATDAVTLLGVAVGAVALSVLASGVPAARVVALNPAQKLREE